MRAWNWAALVGAAAVAAAVAVVGTASARGATHHTVTAAERGSGRIASMTITDPYAAGSKLRRVEYHLRDGYTKNVLIPGGADVAAEDIAICGQAGMRYPDNGFAGTGLPCKPALHATEVVYHQQIGDLAGRFRPHHHVEVTETCHGSGRYLTVGHIDHGALVSEEYYWVNGEHLTVDLPGDALVDHIDLITRGQPLAAVVARHV